MRLAITPPLVLVVFVFIAAVEISAQSVKNSTLPATPWEEAQWKRFMILYNRKFRSPERELKRKEAFLTTLRAVRGHNQESSEDHFLRINMFADWTEEEKEALKGEIDTDNLIPGEVMSDELLRQTVPDSVDLRFSRCMPPIKTQGSCGACYTFAATCPVEYQLCMKTGTLTVLSEENLLDCSQKYGNAGCSGGLALRAWNYIRDSGVVSSSSYPYEGEESLCEISANQVSTNVTSWAYATTSKDENAIKTAVALYGPVSASIDANNWEFYDKGIFSNPKCSQTSTNHAVVIVGYGTDSASKKDFWIIRNSWGRDWGVGGYMFLERGVNMCGIAKRAAYPKL